MTAISASCSGVIAFFASITSPDSPSHLIVAEDVIDDPSTETLRRCLGFASSAHPELSAVRSVQSPAPSDADPLASSLHPILSMSMKVQRGCPRSRSRRPVRRRGGRGRPEGGMRVQIWPGGGRGRGLIGGEIAAVGDRVGRRVADRGPSLASPASSSSRTPMSTNPNERSDVEESERERICRYVSC
ncbi:hypothetical protein B296_00017479 [Ensete ventricosum]|uniref:Uncharacterized protein n=1 Tax=Ensete ventricosum TaxID=4639 RepID=A0A427AIP9_ENSVE|nr:hypothetical protein B296_00017479 [Ensete ventricosum]